MSARLGVPCTSGRVAADPSGLQRYVDASDELRRQVAQVGNNLASHPWPTSTPPLLAEVLTEGLPTVMQELTATATIAGTAANAFLRADGGLGEHPGLGASATILLQALPDDLEDLFTDIAQRAVQLGRGVLAVAPETSQVLRELPVLAPVARVLSGPFGRIAPGIGIVAVAHDLQSIVAAGDPLDAMRRDGFGYTRMIAHALSDGSLLALSVSPSPVTLALALGTTTTWLQLVALDEDFPLLPLPPPLPPVVWKPRQAFRRSGEALTAARAFGSSELHRLEGAASLAREDTGDALAALRRGDLRGSARETLQGLSHIGSAGTNLLADIGAAGARLVS